MIFESSWPHQNPTTSYEVEVPGIDKKTPHGISSPERTILIYFLQLRQLELSGVCLSP